MACCAASGVVFPYDDCDGYLVRLTRHMVANACNGWRSALIIG